MVVAVVSPRMIAQNAHFASGVRPSVEAGMRRSLSPRGTSPSFERPRKAADRQRQPLDTYPAPQAPSRGLPRRGGNGGGTPPCSGGSPGGRPPGETQSPP